jgi:hypothetical protein
VALIPCPECKREISDQAQVCPHCGRPPGVRTTSTFARSWKRTPTSSRLLALLLLGGLGYGALRIVHPAPLTAGLLPAARFNFDNAGGDDSCTVLGDYCMRVKCTVTNAGNASGLSRVAADLVEDGVTIASHRTTTNVLAPGERQTVALDFPEATIASKKAQYRCYDGK